MIFKCIFIHLNRRSIHAIKVGIENRNDSIASGFNKKLLMILIDFILYKKKLKIIINYKVDEILVFFFKKILISKLNINIY